MSRRNGQMMPGSLSQVGFKFFRVYIIIPERMCYIMLHGFAPELLPCFISSYFYKKLYSFDF